MNGRNWRGFDGGARAAQQEGGSALSKVWGASRRERGGGAPLPRSEREQRLPFSGGDPATLGGDGFLEVGANLGGGMDDDPLEEMLRAQEDFRRASGPMRLAPP